MQKLELSHRPELNANTLLDILQRRSDGKFKCKKRVTIMPGKPISISRGLWVQALVGISQNPQGGKTTIMISHGITIFAAFVGILTLLGILPIFLLAIPAGQRLERDSKDWMASMPELR